MCRDRCLAVKLALTENLKNLYIAGFNQIGDLVCNVFVCERRFLLQR